VRDGDRVHPTRDDPVLATLSESVGGPLGARAGRHPWWTPVRVVLALTALCFVLGMVQKAPCFQESWQDSDARYTHMCYSDLPYLYTGRGLAELNWPYSGDQQVRARYDVMEYPAGIAYVAWATAWVTHWVNGSPDIEPRYSMPAGSLFSDEEVSHEVRLFVVLSALGFAVAALLSAWFLTQVNPRRPWDAALFALSPVLALNALINWDLLVVVLVAGALWAWARDRPALTGVLIGLGTATKLFPLLLLGGLLVICLRNRRMRDFGVAVAAAIAAWVLANLPAYLTGSEQWRVFWAFNADRGVDLGSIWLVLAESLDTTFDPSTVNVGSLLFLAVWCLGVLALGLKAPQNPRLAQLGFLVVAGFLLVNKVYSPQYVLWLLPLAVMARPRWRDQLVWQAGEIFYFASVWWYLGGDLDSAGGGTAGFYWLAIVLRMLAELYLVGIVARDVLRPELDPVDRDQPMTTRSNVVAV
jgi:uncharacterized membrane protein